MRLMFSIIHSLVILTLYDSYSNVIILLYIKSVNLILSSSGCMRSLLPISQGLLLTFCGIASTGWVSYLELSCVIVNLTFTYRRSCGEILFPQAVSIYSRCAFAHFIILEDSTRAQSHPNPHKSHGIYYCEIPCYLSSYPGAGVRECCMTHGFRFVLSLCFLCSL